MRDWLTEKVVLLFNLDEGDREKNYGYFEGSLSIGLNLFLFLVKYIFGRVIGSIALITDAFHTVSDVLTSVLVVIGFAVSAKPVDDKHPYGHSRAESVFALFIALILIGVGIGFFIASLRRFLSPAPISVNLKVSIVLILSILIKEFLFACSEKLGEKINSSALKADAWHHRSDSLATALLLLGFIFYKFKFFRLDGILGMGIAGLIVYTGIKIMKEAGDFLIGMAPSDSLLREIELVAQKVEGVRDVHNIQVHDYGKRKAITLHILLKNDTNLDDAHKKADEVERRIKEVIADSDVTVHLEPEDEGDFSPTGGQGKKHGFRPARGVETPIERGLGKKFFPQRGDREKTTGFFPARGVETPIERGLGKKRRWG